jgi:hypothetical protein
MILRAVQLNLLAAGKERMREGLIHAHSLTHTHIHTYTLTPKGLSRCVQHEISNLRNLHLICTLNYLSNVLKNWEEPGDEGSRLKSRLLTP